MNVAINKVAVTVRISTVAAVAVTEATVKQVLGISPSGSATKYLNEQGDFTTPAGGGGGSVAWGSITGSLIAQTDLQNALNAKEATANKATTMTGNTASDVKFLTAKAVYDWVISLGYITAAALTGYATQAWVAAQGYITSAALSGYATEAWVTAQGYITNVVTALGYTPVPNTRSISTSSPLSGGGNLTADRTLSIADAAADGSTKGAAAFTAADFNSAAGVISINYANGQSASASAKGFLTQADWSIFNGKQNALGFTAENVANKSTTFSTDKASDTKYPSVKSVYDFISYIRPFYQTTAETSLTGNTNETLVDTITFPANTLAANDMIQILSRALKTTTAAGTLRIYINSSASLSGATLLATYTMATATRFVGLKRTIAVKASGLIEVFAAGTGNAPTDDTGVAGVETTTTVTLSNTLHILVSMQLTNSGDTMRRSFTQVQIQRAL